MGDVSELRGLITVVGFFGVLVLLIGILPSDIYVPGTQREIEVPDEWNGIPLRTLNFTDTWEHNMTDDYTVDLFTVGGRNLSLDYEYPNFIKMFHRSGVGLWWYEAMRWYNERGQERQYNPGEYGLDADIIDEDYSIFGKLEYIVKSTWPFSVTTMFFFNNTAYSTPSEAWDDLGLSIFVGISWEHSSTVFSAWDIIGMLLFYQMPDVNPILNSLIAIPCWISIAYISFIIVLRAIGALFGGGA